MYTYLFRLNRANVNLCVILFGISMICQCAISLPSSVNLERYNAIQGMATKDEVKKKRKSAKSSFHRVYNVLIVDAEKKDTKIDVLMTQLNDLELKYQRLEEHRELLIEVLESDNEDDKTTERTVTKDMESMYTELVKVKKLVHGKRGKGDEKKGFVLVQIKKLLISGNIRDQERL